MYLIADSIYVKLGLRISWVEFQIPKPLIPDSTSKNFPDYGVQITLYGEKRGSAFPENIRDRHIDTMFFLAISLFLSLALVELENQSWGSTILL